MSETVNPANGQVSIRIQVPMPPGRKLTVPFSFAYDSSGTHHPRSAAPGYVVWGSNASYLSQGGWSYSVPMVNLAQLTKSWKNPLGQQMSCTYYTDYVLQDAKGSRHALGLSVVLQPTSPGCTGQGLITGLTGGDDFVQATVGAYPTEAPLIVADADGTVYYFSNPGNRNNGTASLANYIEDRNGNEVLITDNGNGSFTMSDTLNRTAVSSSGFGTSEDTINVSGFSNPYDVYWGTSSFNFSPGSTTSSDQYCPSVIPNGGGTLPVVTSINLPNGQQYKFYYDSTYGLLNQITYPSGAYVKYTWELNSQSEFGTFADSGGNQYACQYTYGMAAVASRSVSFDGVNVQLVQDFSYSTSNWNSGLWGSKQTTVTTYDQVRGTNYTTVYNYSPHTVSPPLNDHSAFSQQVPIEQTVEYNNTSGSNIRTVTKNWVDQYEMQGEQVSDNGTVTSDNFFVFYGGGVISDKYECGSGQTCYNATQSSPPTAYARHTHTQYQNFAATPIYPSNPSIIDRPSSVIVYNGSGSRVAETDYAYDAGSVSSASATNHDNTNYGASKSPPRGNATSMSKWVNTSSTSLTWTYTYDDTGQMLTASDPASNGTQYSYADSFPACGTAGGSTNAYLTQITDAKQFTQKFNYRFCDGQLNSSTDRNSQTTSYSYSDSLNRLTGISYPDTGSTTYGYGTNICAQPTSTTIALGGGHELHRKRRRGRGLSPNPEGRHLRSPGHRYHQHYV